MTIYVNADTGEVTGDITGQLPGENAGLFNGADYQQPRPALDGYRADTLKLAFAGNIDIKLDDDVTWFQNLRFGQELELHVTAFVGKHGWTLKKTSDDGETVTHTLGLTVHTINTAAEDV